MWYVIQTKVGEEQRVCEKCKNAFFEGSFYDAFVPHYQYMKRYQGAWHKECRVLFPDYFFVDSLSGKEIYKSLEILKRIAKPICVGKEFLPIKIEEQNFLISMMNGEYIIPFSLGNQIDLEYEIYEGPLQGKEYRICKVNRHKRIAELEISLFGEIKK